MLPCRDVAIGSDLTESDHLWKGLTTMQIRSRMSMSADGYITTPGGWPALTADPAFVSGESHGIREFLEGCEAALMGRSTFEPALNNDRWPWPTLNVFVLASDRPAGTPDHVVVDSDPAQLLEKIRSCWRRSARPTRAATCTSSAARARSRPSAPSERSTSSSSWCCPCSSAAGCS
jgi:hypothetical protein